MILLGTLCKQRLLHNKSSELDYNIILLNQLAVSSYVLEYEYLCADKCFFDYVRFNILHIDPFLKVGAHIDPFLKGGGAAEAAAENVT